MRLGGGPFIPWRKNLRGARVSYKENAAGDLVFAVIVPAVRMPPQ
jgi:hypothetical protein